MVSIANPPRPRHYNATLSAAGWGTIYVKIITIGHGMSIVSSESEGRRGKTMYITRRTSGSFGVTFMCSSYGEYVHFGRWIEGYGRRVAESAPAVGPVRVLCPVRNFDKVAIPNGVSFGDTSFAHVYPVAINFLGSRDPVPLTAEYVSSFSLPSGGEESLPYFYPGGQQLSGQQEGVDSGYDQGFDSDFIAPPASDSVPPSAGGGAGNQRPV